MTGYLNLARAVLAAYPLESAPPGYEENEENEETPPWDQAEAERLLDHLRREVARLEAAWPGGKFPPGQANVVQIAVEVCESYATNYDLEAARGWDALALLRRAVPWAVEIAGRRHTPPAAAPDLGHEEGLCRCLESYFGWPEGSAALWDPPKDVPKKDAPCPASEAPPERQEAQAGERQRGLFDDVAPPTALDWRLAL